MSPVLLRFLFSLLAAYSAIREKKTLYMITSSHTLDLYMMQVSSKILKNNQETHIIAVATII
jgi:hypothetical protein